MEFVSVLVILLMVTLAFGLAILLLGGIAALFGLRFRRFLKRAAWLLLLPSLVFAYGALIERNCFSVKRVEIESGKLPKAFDGYRVVQISDIHLRSFQGRGKALQRAVDKINALDPDIIAFTGDLVTLSAEELSFASDILSQLRAADGVFSVMGNHDYLPYNEALDSAAREEGIRAVRDFERRLGWQLLENGCVNIGRCGSRGEGLGRGDSDCDSPGACDCCRISVIGVENIAAKGSFASYGDIAKASESATGQFRILLSHDPSAWEAYVVGQTDIDLTLSGHTHEMQFSLFGLSPSALLYKQHKGLYCSEDLSGGASAASGGAWVPSGGASAASGGACAASGGAWIPSGGVCAAHTGASPQYLYVNIGLGETIFPARIGAPAEITQITLRSLAADAR